MQTQHREHSTHSRVPYETDNKGERRGGERVERGRRRDANKTSEPHGDCREEISRRD
jgi:hypothetical protein